MNMVLDRPAVSGGAGSFLETVESLTAFDASAARLFGGEGRGLRRVGRSPEHIARLAEAARFLSEVRDGNRPAYHLQEAMTTSDFPLMFGQIIDRLLLANYTAIPQTYRNYVKIATVADFRQVYRFALNGAQAVLTQVAELTEYPEASLSEARYAYAVTKYGKTVPLSWETIVNDQIGAFDDLPTRLAISARNTEEKFATTLFVDASGPHASLYTSGNKNIINTTNGAASTNPPLSVAAVQDGLTVLSKMVDSDGNPIVITAVRLVVPPALRVTAKNILNAVQIWATSAGAGGVPADTTATPHGSQQLIINNWMTNDIQLDVNAFIPVVASSANGNTSWFLFADVASGRPALEMGFLRGHETPELFMKDPNSIRVGGGTVGPMDGDFDTDAVKYKVRHVLGGARLDPKATVASNGSGS
jgi:hypothetical protein